MAPAKRSAKMDEVKTREARPEPGAEMPAVRMPDAEKMGRSQDEERSRESHRTCRP
jgi:hypothetical protein